jgi:hypothetical protein
MLLFGSEETLPEVPDVSIYQDHENPRKYYLLGHPHLRLREDGRPASFNFLTYRLAVDRPDGKTGGGYVNFTTDMSIPQKKLEKIKKVLQERHPGQEVSLGRPTFLDGSTDLQVVESEVLVEQVNAAARPSMYGDMVAPFSVELTPEGAAVFEKALQGSGGFVTVIYNLTVEAVLPPVTARVYFDIERFKEFTHKLEREERKRGFFIRLGRFLFGRWKKDTVKVTEEITTELEEERVGGVEINFLSDEISDDIKTRVMAWAQETWRDQMRSLLELNLDEFTTQPEEGEEEGQGIPEGVTDFERIITEEIKVGFDITFTHNQATNFPIASSGSLQPIPTMKGPDGEPLKWEDFSQEIDADHPFFRRRIVPVRVNVPFKDLNIFSVDVHAHYPPNNRSESYHFTNPDETEQFKFFVEDDNHAFNYRYEVNYRGESRTFASEKLTSEDELLTINVDDTGIWYVNLHPGKLNWDQVSLVRAHLRYEDRANGIGPIERKFSLTRENAEHEIRVPIFAPRRNPYEMQLKYFMVDGKEYTLDWQEHNANQYAVNDPFSATMNVRVRAVGDLQNEIQNIFVDLRYEDEQNDYIRTASTTLNAQQSFFDWAVPVISEKEGRIFYSGQIAYQDGRVEAIPEQEAEEQVLMVGSVIADRLKIEVFPDLIDWDQVKLLHMALAYEDTENGISESANLVFRNGEMDPLTHEFVQKDKTQNEYEWKATFIMDDDNRRVEVGPKRTTDTVLFPEPTTA